MSFDAQIYYLISWCLGISAGNITEETDLRSDLNLDPIDIELLLFQIENFFTIEFTLQEINELNTVEDISAIVLRRSPRVQNVVST
jgi:acyl carrier protein